MRKQLLLGGGVVALLGGAALLARPAALRGARVADIQPLVPVRARIELSYGSGARPVSVIVDLSAPSGGGSATVSGDQDSFELPVIGSLDGACRVVTTATYRVAGRLHTRVREFEARRV